MKQNTSIVCMSTKINWRLNMYSIPGSTLLIDDEKQIYNSDKTKHAITIIDNKVSIDMFGKTVIVDLDWLLAASQYRQIFNVDDIGNVVFVPLPENKTYSRDKFNYYVSFKRPMYYGSGNKYRVVPRFRNIAISRDGKEIVSLLAKRKLHTHNELGYECISANDLANPGHARNMKVHRLVANAWLKNPNPYECVVVNHKNGIKTDNDSRNLEWCSYRHNSVHAIENDLSKDNVHCKIRDIVTGEVFDFPSITSMTRYLGIANKNTEDYHSRFPNYTIHKRYEVRVGDDTRPWFYTDPDIQNIEQSRYVITIIEPGGGRKVFNGARSVIQHYKLWNNGSGIRYVVRSFKKAYPEYKISIQNMRPSYVVQIRNDKTGDISEVDNIKVAVSATGCSMHNIQKSILSKGELRLDGTFRFRRKSTRQNWPVPHDYVKLNCAKRITVIDTINNTISEFSSIKETSRKLGLSKPTVVRWLKTGKIHRGLKFTYTDV